LRAPECRIYVADDISIIMERLTGSSITKKWGPCDPPTNEKPGLPLDCPGSGVRGLPVRDFKLQTFEVTLSMPVDVTPDDDRWMLKWIGRNCSHAYLVAERGENDKRHYHMCICLKEPRQKRYLKDSFVDYFKKVYPTMVSTYAIVVVVQYDHVWYETYLRKETGVEVLYSSYDALSVAKCFPDADVQAELQSIRDINRSSDPRFAGLHAKFLEWYSGDLRTITRSVCLEFLYTMMFKDKTMQCVTDPRRRHQMAETLYRYVTQDCKLDAVDRKWSAEHDGYVAAW